MLSHGALVASSLAQQRRLNKNASQPWLVAAGQDSGQM